MRTMRPEEWEKVLATVLWGSWAIIFIIAAAIFIIRGPG